ncbi:hypothetical protein RIF29_04562 [Crotalaria pallida]|uniref:Uncharacterized protein n=1 Tax=Crotalaria pallida TaxID=3830 RepID=A0AAN9J238_CROPI
MTTPSTKILPNYGRSFIIHLCEHNMEDGSQRIPQQFLYSGMFLPNPIVVQVPTKRVWNIELNCYDGEVWLQDGWKKFRSDLSAGNNACLSFIYDEGTCVFHVKAWQYSCFSEIQYPPMLPSDDDDVPTFYLTLKDYMIEADSLVKIRYALPFPRAYVVEYISSRMEHEAIVVHKNNSVRITMSTPLAKSTCFLTNGWKEFAINNGFDDDEEFKIKVYVNDVNEILLEFHIITL